MKDDNGNILHFPGKRSDNDDVLSSLRDALSEAAPKSIDQSAADKSPNPKQTLEQRQADAPPNIRQKIKGSGNVQVAGDVHVHPDRELPENGDFIACPACRELVGRYADVCLRCGNNVAAHYHALFKQAGRDRAFKFMAFFGGIFFTSLILLQLDIFPESWRFYLGGACALSGFCALFGAREM